MRQKKADFSMILGMLIFLLPGISAESYFFSHDFAFTVTDGVDLLVENGVATLFLKLPSCDRWCWQEFREKDLVYGSDGYSRLSAFDRELTLILGGNHLLLEDPSDLGISMYLPAPERPDGVHYAKTYEFRIQRITPSSVYEEMLNGKVVRYSADFIMNRFIRDDVGIERLWNHALLPWVEGEPGPGIGVTLEIEFTEPVDHMIVLNGFVDPGRKHLYKANSRIKKARIRSLDPAADFSFEYEFEDKVQFTHIPFPASTRMVQLEILDAFPGERWQDTAVSGILTNHEWDRYGDGSIQRMKQPEHQFE